MKQRWRLVATCALLAVAACNRQAPTAQPAHDTPGAAPVEPAQGPASGPDATPATSAAPLPAASLAIPIDPSAAVGPGDAETAADDASASAPVPAASPPVPATSPSATTAPVAEQRFAPRDDCAALPGWPAFRAKLAKAVAGKDAAALAALAVPAIKLDYGGGAGREELRRRLADPKRDTWRELARILPLGCAVADGIVAMPWYFWNLPPDADAYSAMLVTGDAVPLRARPAPDARTLATLDWSMVTVSAGRFDPAARYTPVHTRAGKLDGYVLTEKLRSVLSWRLIAERQGGEWKLTAFISGD